MKYCYPRARAHPRCEVSCHGTKSTCIVGLSMLRRGQPDSEQGYLVLQSRSTCCLVAKFLQHWVVACSTQISGRMLRTRPQTGVCKSLMPDVVAPKAHENNRSYVSSEDLPLDSLHKNLAWWGVTQRNQKNHKTVKTGGGGVGAWAGMGACLGEYGT